MGGIVLRGLHKRYGSRPVLVDVSLAVAAGELVTVLGPSGCGKTTLLRVIAGLEPLTAGTIEVGGRRVDTLAPAARDIAMVFQSYALYPHLTVRENIEFPLRMRGVDAATRRQRAAAVAEMLDVGDLLGRRPAELSGGQRQRVALARALVREPAGFLLDEPLSNLDARLRASVRQYIRAVQRRVGVTTLYVTHDQVEAMTLGDRLVVLEAGHVRQVDRPVAVYERPATAFVAGLLGVPPMNLVPGRYAGGVLVIGDRALPPDGAVRARLGAFEGALTVGIRPEAFGPPAPGAAVVMEVGAGAAEILGSETLVRGRLGGAPVVARLPGIVREPPAALAAPSGALHFFRAGDGTRIGHDGPGPGAG